MGKKRNTKQKKINKQTKKKKSMWHEKSYSTFHTSFQVLVNIYVFWDHP
jgi:hypothetical protein